MKFSKVQISSINDYVEKNAPEDKPALSNNQLWKDLTYVEGETIVEPPARK